MSDNDQADHGDETTAKDPTVQEALEVAEARIAELENELANVKGQLKKAATAAKPSKAQGRKVDPKLAPVDGDDGEGNAVTAAQGLAARIAAAESVELVALDAKHREIAGFTQEIVGGGDAWRIGANGLRLALPTPLEVTAPGDRRSEIHAWGLILDGKAAAFGARFEPLVLNAGQRTDLSNDVIF